MSLHITAASELLAKHGDFGARLSGQELRVPPDVAIVLKRQKLRTAEELLDRSRSFPTSMARAFGWSDGELVEARARLVKLLTGHVRAVFLNPSEPPHMSLGAFAPDDATTKPGDVVRGTRSKF